ncbi:MAG: hypothetical protein ABEJ57_08545 [Halobacteriaceae archaeon]
MAPTVVAARGLFSPMVIAARVASAARSSRLNSLSGRDVVGSVSNRYSPPAIVVASW